MFEYIYKYILYSHRAYVCEWNREGKKEDNRRLYN